MYSYESLPQPTLDLRSGLSDGYLAGLEYMKNERAMSAIEDQFPGLSSIFSSLVEMLPDSVVGSNEFPIAAAVIRKRADGSTEVLSKSMNEVNAEIDSTAHADFIVLKEAQEKTGDKHLEDCALLTTLCPCMQCSGGAVNTSVGTVVYGLSHSDVRGTHARVSGGYKPYRTTPAVIDTDVYLTESGITVIGGYKKEEIKDKLYRTHGSLRSHFMDPDA